MYRLTVQTIFIGVFLAHCTLAIGQHSDTTYRILENKSFPIPSTDWIGALNGVTIQNSFPKGDRHTDSSGKVYGIAIFWTRVINETPNPLELTINFPADSFAILSSPDFYLKIFLPPDSMTLDKVPLYNYGIASLTSFLDTGLNKTTRLQRTIDPNEECLFYTAVLQYQVPNQVPRLHRPGLHQGGGGVTRTALVLKDQRLFYRISIDRDSQLIHCGQIVFKK
jgi:hypothetical protein